MAKPEISNIDLRHYPKPPCAMFLFVFDRRARGGFPPGAEEILAKFNVCGFGASLLC